MHPHKFNLILFLLNLRAGFPAAVPRLGASARPSAPPGRARLSPTGTTTVCVCLGPVLDPVTDFFCRDHNIKQMFVHFLKKNGQRRRYKTFQAIFNFNRCGFARSV